MKPSKSEKRGLATLCKTDLNIYSVGISTGGSAEIEMARRFPQRQIIATTLDQGGEEFAKKRIEEAHLTEQITAKLENVAELLPYESGFFDFIYARLVLHYLSEADLEKALKELFRVLKAGGRLFVVVRSTKCSEAKKKEAKFDPATKLTTYFANGETHCRYFHTEETIQKHLISAGFQIESTDVYEERLCADFYRLEPSDDVDTLIEVVGSKRGRV